MSLLLYLANLLFAALAVFPLNALLNKLVGNSLSVQETLNGFNFTFTADLLNNYGANFSVIFNQSIVVIALFFLLSVFLMGGILNILKSENSYFFMPDFWRGCTKYFWRLLRLSLYFILMQAALFFLFFTLFKFFSGGFSPFALDSENNWTFTFKVLVPIYAFFVSLLLMAQDYAKVHLVHKERRLVLASFFQSFGLLFRKFLPCIILFVLTGLTTALIWWLYSFASNKMEANTFSSIGIAFLIGQLFLFFRIGMNLLNLGSVNHLFKTWNKKSY